jgi:SAM-dependent methyltransferase
VLEIKDPGYTTWFGGAQVTQADVLDVDPGNDKATIVADLSAADSVPSEQFDCFVFTQTLHIIYDVQGALRHAARLLKPGGVLLCTVPAVSRINYEDGGLDRGDYWRFTEASLRRLFATVFPVENVRVIPYGNVQVCTAFLYGMSSKELSTDVLDHLDPWFPLGYLIRAVKPLGRNAGDDDSISSLEKW